MNGINLYRLIAFAIVTPADLQLIGERTVYVFIIPLKTLLTTVLMYNAIMLLSHV